MINIQLGSYRPSRSDKHLYAEIKKLEEKKAMEKSLHHEITRQRKFRAYNIIDKCWHPIRIDNFETDPDNPTTLYVKDEDGGIEFSEYTNFKDDYNIEIYEYDIIQDRIGNYFLVEFDLFLGGWVLNGPECKKMPLFRELGQCKIVGNKYDNPEFFGHMEQDWAKKYWEAMSFNPVCPMCGEEQSDSPDKEERRRLCREHLIEKHPTMVDVGIKL